MAVVDHRLGVKRVPAPGAPTFLPGNQQFEGVLVRQRHRPQVRPEMAGGWLSLPELSFHLLLDRHRDAAADDVAEVRVRVVDRVLPLLVVEVACASSKARQRPRLAFPDSIAQGPPAPNLARTQPVGSLLLSDAFDQSEMSSSRRCHLRLARGNDRRT
ncbi:hypothetical protein OG824_26875 [Streptomyces prunicolor]|uniref:hypothetical protein n=1 Tax=Streptomyces prunicolor TaxID=67348 RepID=UPI00225BAB37|nr:hypothetical protein [Streptomyces prunicolor]MCX5238831.1 hypothetical protein [Streptomyces prunicolor]